MIPRIMRANLNRSENNLRELATFHTLVLRIISLFNSHCPLYAVSACINLDMTEFQRIA